MTTLAEVREAVISLTKRPDKAVFISDKINAAVRTISAMGRFPQDLYEETYTGAALADSYTQSLDLPTRTRVVAYIQDPLRTATISLREVKYILANPTKQDVCYQAGNRLQLKLATKPTALNVGVYRYPAVLLDADTNWILEDFTALITDFAAAWVNIVLGNKELAGDITQWASSQLSIHVADRINLLYSPV